MLNKCPKRKRVKRKGRRERKRKAGSQGDRKGREKE